MNILELIIILFFGFIIISQLFDYFLQRVKLNRITEGLENGSQENTVKTPHTYDEYIGLQNTDPLFLAIKNASNIAFLKSQIDDITNIRQEINQMNNDIQANNTQIESIQQSLVQDLNSPEDENEEVDDERMIEGQENLTEVNVIEETNMDEEI